MRRSRATKATTIPDDGTVDLAGLEVDDFFFDGETEAELAADGPTATPPTIDVEPARRASAQLPAAAPIVEPVPAPPAAPAPPAEPPTEPAPGAEPEAALAAVPAHDAELDDERSWGVTDFFAEVPDELAPQNAVPTPTSTSTPSRERARAPHQLEDELLELEQSPAPAKRARRDTEVPAGASAESPTLARWAPRAPRPRRWPAIDQISPRLSVVIAVAGVVLAVAAVSGAMPGAGQSPAIAGPSAADSGERREKAVSGARSLRPVSRPISRSVRKAARAARARHVAAERRAKARARKVAAQRRARASLTHAAAARRAEPVRRAQAAPTVSVAPQRAYTPPATARPSVPRSRPAAKSPAGKEFGW